MQLCRQEHHARVGREPQDRPVGSVWPGEDALRIRCQQPLRAEVTTISNQAVSIGRVRVWKSAPGGEARGWHSNYYYPISTRKESLAARLRCQRPPGATGVWRGVSL